MSYFPDLSPYDYGTGVHPGVVHVGWLDGHHDYPKGSVPEEIVERLRGLATQPTELHMGLHVCELCPTPEALEKAHFAGSPECLQKLLEWETPRSSNGEIRVTFEGVTYAAPVLIVHNIEVHRYRPPAVFLRAVMEGAANQPLGSIRKLPEDMLSSANLDSGSPAWRLSDFADVLQRATAHRFVCLGGQFEFRGPIRLAKNNLPTATAWTRSRGQDWGAYVGFVNGLLLEDFRWLVKETDFRALALQQKGVVDAIASGAIPDLMEHVYFAAKFGRDPESEIAKGPANSLMSGG